jgi:hypothetical protein
MFSSSSSSAGWAHFFSSPVRLGPAAAAAPPLVTGTAPPACFLRFVAGGSLSHWLLPLLLLRRCRLARVDFATATNTTWYSGITLIFDLHSAHRSRAVYRHDRLCTGCWICFRAKGQKQKLGKKQCTHVLYFVVFSLQIPRSGSQRSSTSASTAGTSCASQALRYFIVSVCV